MKTNKPFQIIKLVVASTVVTVYIDGNVHIEIPKTLFNCNRLPRIGDSIFLEQQTNESGYVQTNIFINGKKLEKKSDK